MNGTTFTQFTNMTKKCINTDSSKKVNQDRRTKEAMPKAGDKPPQQATEIPLKELTLELSKITQDEVFRCRVQDDEETIKQYAEVFMECKKASKNPKYPFQPIVVWKKGKKYILIAGFHRFKAARKAKVAKIQVRVFEGTEDEAFMLALKDNSTHGLRLNSDDLKYCIEKALLSFTLILALKA